MLTCLILKPETYHFVFVVIGKGERKTNECNRSDDLPSNKKGISSSSAICDNVMQKEIGKNRDCNKKMTTLVEIADFDLKNVKKEKDLSTEDAELDLHLKLEIDTETAEAQGAKNPENSLSARIEAAFREEARTTGDLSLIHISEPTRPY